MSDRTKRGASGAFEIKVPTRAALLSTAGVILLGLSFLSVETYNMMPPILPGYPGDAFFPRLVLGFCVIWAVIILARSIFLSQAAAAARYEAPYVVLHWLEFASVIVLVLLYALLVEPVGFEITTVVLMMALLVPRLLAGPRATPARAALLALALSLATMLILYAGLGPGLKIGLPLKFLPTYIQ
ncbi:MAG: tripartite tricarboxylate transporter TctB family protein [Betaproteobacteria bacterium]|nr:tripartite tricarboxylate transporter TctB family protein [Betaproteobacteria bacterium]MDH3437850.1 tripartite tricarboxylate transporter TctB family protein [Betaproteobacteria bacterium]